MPRLTPHNLREHYRDDACLLPELLCVGHDEHSASIRSLSGHTHPDAYEICYIARGSVEWWAGRRVYRVNRGDVYITRPGEMHGGLDSMMHPCELYFILIAFPSRGAMPGLTVETTQRLTKGYAAIQARCFPASERVHAGMRRLFDEHRQRDGHSFAAARGALQVLLVDVLRDHHQAVRRNLARGAKPSLTISRALAWMEARIGEDFAVEDAAASAGLGVSRFHERFLREVGLTPNDYRARRRIELARTALREGDEPITRIAMRLGFGSSQYFATVFRKLTGVSPREYRTG